MTDPKRRKRRARRTQRRELDHARSLGGRPLSPGELRRILKR